MFEKCMNTDKTSVMQSLTRCYKVQIVWAVHSQPKIIQIENVQP